VNTGFGQAGSVGQGRRCEQRASALPPVVSVTPVVPVTPVGTSVEEERLAEAEVRLYRAKLEALLGIRYDAEEYDRIVEQYRAAKQHADAARVAAQQAGRAQAAFSNKRSGSANVTRLWLRAA
jgi:hypothetical protein